MAEVVARHTPVIDAVEPHLVLDGLRLFFEVRPVRLLLEQSSSPMQTSESWSSPEGLAEAEPRAAVAPHRSARDRSADQTWCRMTFCVTNRTLRAL